MTGVSFAVNDSGMAANDGGMVLGMTASSFVVKVIAEQG
jgi:hypothetical protein